MEILSKEYGWLPSQIENEEANIINEYLTIISIRRYLQEQEIRKAERK